MDVGVYARLSKDDEADQREDEERAIERQLRLCRESAEERGWTIVEEFQDNGKSAYKPGLVRRGYEALLEAIETGRAEAVLVYNVDRLFRQDKERARFFDKVTGAGVFTVGVVDGADVDLRTADGRFNFQSLGAAAEHQSARMSERLRRKMDALAASGKRWGGRRPFGYTADLKIDRKEAAVVRRGAEMILGGASVHRVAAAWNESGSRTPTGKRWTVRGVRAILTSGLIAGLREHRRDGEVVGVYQGKWPAIVTPEDHARIRKILPRSKGSGSAAPRKHLLTNLLTCGECGIGLTGRTQPDGRRSYWCSPTVGGCGRVAIGANGAEDFVLDEVQRSDPEYKLKRRLSARKVDRAALAGITAKRAVLAEAAAIGADVRAALARLDDEEAALIGDAPARHPTDPEKDDPGRRDRRHRGELSEAEVVQSRDWVAAWVERAVVRRAKSTREPAANRITVIWKLDT